MEDSGAVDNNAPTILNVLANDICRRKILDYVPINDLVRSERVCKAWQNAVNDYLEHRCILTVDIARGPRLRYLGSRHRTVKFLDDCPLPVFSKTIEKLGPSVVGVSTDRCDRKFFEKLEAKCNQLRHLEFKNVSASRQNNSEQQSAETWQNIGKEGLPCLKFNNLKSLSLINCRSLDLAHVYLASYLPNITNLELDGIPRKTLVKVHLLLDKMPGVISVSLRCQNLMFPNEGYQEIRASKEFIECFGRLGQLRRLKMIMNHSTYRELLEALARGCKRLEHLHIAGSRLMQCERGFAALILRAPGAVTTINFIQDVAPKTLNDLLKNLEAYGCGGVTDSRVCLQERRSPLKFKLGPAVGALGTDQLPELKITIDSFRLGDDMEGDLEYHEYLQDNQ